MRRVLQFVLFIAAIFSIAGVTGCASIGPGNVGIQISKAGSSRGVQDVAVKTGFVLYNPMWTEIVEYPTYVQTVKWTASSNEGKASDESITFTTKDNSVVNADISLSYQLEYDKTPAFYVKYRADDIEKFTDGYMRNVVRDTFDELGGNYTVEEVMGNNGPYLSEVKKKVQSILQPDGIVISQLGFIGAPRPPESVTQSINEKVKAQQLGLQKQNELVQAEADAKKEVARANGDAQSNIIRAQSDAQANKLRGESLTPQLLEWRALEKWDGHRPQVEGSGSGLMLNLNK